MEISKLTDTSLKIKGKNASVVLDPTTKVDAEIVIATQPIESLALDKVEGTRLVIAGPGEYEAGGISVTGKQTKDGVSYLIFESVKILIVSSTALTDVPDDEEYDCLLVKVTGEFKEDLLGPINKKCTVLYGDLSLVELKTESQEKATKINLKKTAEIQGKTFLLA